MQTLEGTPCFVHAGPVRQHRPRQQLDHRRPDRAASWPTTWSPRAASAPTWARRSSWTSSAAYGGLAPELRGHRRHRPRAQDAPGGFDGRARQAARRGAADENLAALEKGMREPRQAHREHEAASACPSWSPSTASPTDTRRARSRSCASARWRPAPTTPCRSEVHARAARAASELAEAVVDGLRASRASFKFLYPLDASHQGEDRDDRHARSTAPTAWTTCPRPRPRSSSFTEQGFDKLPICMAKTHLSLSHDPTLKGRPRGYALPDPRHPRPRRRRLPLPALRRDAHHARPAQAAGGASTSTSTRDRPHRRAVLEGSEPRAPAAQGDGAPRNRQCGSAAAGHT